MIVGHKVRSAVTMTSEGYSIDVGALLRVTKVFDSGAFLTVNSKGFCYYLLPGEVVEINAIWPIDRNC